MWALIASVHAQFKTGVLCYLRRRVFVAGTIQRPLAEEFILRSVGVQVTELQVFSKDVDTTVVVWGGRNSSI